MSAGASAFGASAFVGSTEHCELLCRFFVDTHNPYQPRDLPWPTLDEATRMRLASLPIWEEALKTEADTAAIVSRMGETERDPALAQAIALQGYEEARHAELLRLLMQKYAIPLPELPATVPRDPSWAFMRIGYGECFDSFFAFGLFALARESGFFPPELVALFEPVMQEEGRHIIFHVNWVAYQQRRLGFARRPAYVFRRGLAMWLQMVRRLRTALRLKRQRAGSEQNFTLNAHHFADVSPRAFVELCLAENDRRLAPHAPRLLRPTFVARVARSALKTLPGKSRRADDVGA